MPIYEYTCRECESRFELLVRASEVPACPDCSSTQLAKELSVPAAHVASSGSLPVCKEPVPQAGCGRPQCGAGFCAGP